jgi:hypothetical protein
MPFFKFRPEHDTRVDDLTDPIEWEDNPLSNGIAAISFYLFPKWCQKPEHWTTRFMDYFFTSCPCCMFYRGIAVGAVPLLVIIIILLMI